VSPKIHKPKATSFLGSSRDDFVEYILNYVGLALFGLAFLLIFFELNDSGIFSASHGFALSQGGMQLLSLGIISAFFAVVCLVGGNYRKLCNATSEIHSELKGNYPRSEKLVVVTLVAFNVVAALTFLLVFYQYLFITGDLIIFYIFLVLWGLVNAILFFMYQGEKAQDHGDVTYFQVHRRELMPKLVSGFAFISLCGMLMYGAYHHYDDSPVLGTLFLFSAMVVVFVADIIRIKTKTNQWKLSSAMLDVGYLMSFSLFMWCGVHFHALDRYYTYQKTVDLSPFWLMLPIIGTLLFIATYVARGKLESVKGNLDVL